MSIEGDKLSELLGVLQLFEYSSPKETTQYIKLRTGFELRTGTMVVDKDGYMKPISSTDAAAPVNSIYYSTTANKLVYKTSAGVVNALY